MSADILQRLRAASRDERLSTGALYTEAADEIERLRTGMNDMEVQLIDRAHEVNTLREALRRISFGHDTFGSKYPPEHLRGLATQALRALRGEKS